MKHPVITYVFLSCVLFFLHVCAQTSCPTGWFGSNCKYKCRCTNNSCDIDGNCRSPFRCLGGWFGPACQYVDLAYGTADQADITDGDDSTCVTSSITSTVDLKFSQSWLFTWLRVHLNTNVTDIERRLTVVLMQNSSVITCTSLRAYVIDQRTADIHCNVTYIADHVFLDGDAVGDLCSVYVSGGRNVAVKENATQSTTYSEFSGRTWYVNVKFNASLAVDGTVAPDLYDPPYCASTRNQSNPFWLLRLSQERLVHTYVIHNRGTSPQLIGLELQSVDSHNRSVFYGHSNVLIARPMYYMNQPYVPVQTIILKPRSVENMLTLCEMEVYGDSVCAARKYGLECDQTCNCRNPNDQCLVTTGHCPSGCAAGYMGPQCTTHTSEEVSGCAAGYMGTQCTTECAKDTYGQDCQHSCNKNCVPSTDSNRSSCGHVSGDCLNGCLAGYTGHDCTAKCPKNTYGQGCQQPCSQNCTPPSDPNTPLCDHVDGICLNGCPSGVTGHMCVTRCPKDLYGLGCQGRCNQKCQPPSDPSRSSCNNTDGSCLIGCLPGYTGSMCTQRCAKGTYGRGCLLPCSQECIPPSDASKSSCDHTDGTCLSGCPSGVSGDMCVAKCPKGKYGKGCQLRCLTCEPSTDANKPSCYQTDGSCVIGCRPGYTGSRCDKKCTNDTYGPDCGQRCSKTCVPSSQAKSSSCHHIRGMCLNGCKSGFDGSYCTEETMDASSMTEYIVAMCLLLAIFFFLLICLCRKKSTVTKSEVDNIPTNIPRAVGTQGPEPDKDVANSPGRQSRSEAFTDNEVAASSV